MCIMYIHIYICFRSALQVKRHVSKAIIHVENIITVSTHPTSHPSHHHRLNPPLTALPLLC